MASAWDIRWGCLLLSGWMAVHHFPSHPHPIPTPPLVLIPLTLHCQHFLFPFSHPFLSPFPLASAALIWWCGCCLPCWPIPACLAPARRLPHQFSEEALLTFYSYSKRTMFSDLNLNIFQKLYRSLFWASCSYHTSQLQWHLSKPATVSLNRHVFTHNWTCDFAFYVDFWFENEVPATFCYCSESQWLVL